MSLQGHHVLIVDDNPTIRELLHFCLEENGAVVDQAGNGLEALRRMRDLKGDIELVVTDLVMPDMEGVTLIRALRRDYPGVKVIAISGGGYVSPADYLSDAKVLGAQAVLAKPFDPSELVSVADELLHGPH